ncbi:MAG TPA: DUF3037 domain-containing protein [Ktedonobacteraceae bacterium]|nr:DUF3037 domain-containing protein [Ktedonobacteraceae bacterium]
MPTRNSYDYALVRLVPHVERGECINAGVILFCRTQRFLGALIHLDEPRALALAPYIDFKFVYQHLHRISLICVGGEQAGSIGQLSQSERFHWLVSPRSTIIQTSPVHSGLCSDPAATLEKLFKKMVLLD